MKKINKKLFLILSSITMLIMSIFLFNLSFNSPTSQEEVIKELELNKGKYDEYSIVLENTNEGKVKEIAKALSVNYRITHDGSYARLYLDEEDILSIYKNEEYKDYLQYFSIDYEASIAEIEEIEEEYVVNPSKYTPNDEFYSKQTYLDYLNLSSIWENVRGDGITVAVIDTGIDTDHPEFIGKISEYSYNATEDKIVKDYVLEDGSYDWSLVEDEQGHGTAVTGVIAASMDNGIGITGIAPDVTIITIKAECDEKGNFKRTSDLVFGLYYAIERDVNVVNMSFGTQRNEFAKPAKLAVDSDIICIAAAGNDATTELTYPAADPM